MTLPAQTSTLFLSTKNFILMATLDTPFEQLSSRAELNPMGLHVLYHRSYDSHYIRIEGEEDVNWYEITALGGRIVSLSEQEARALEEQFQNAKSN